MTLITTISQRLTLITGQGAWWPLLLLYPLLSPMSVKLRVVPTMPAQGDCGMPSANVMTPPPRATADTITIIARVLLGSKEFNLNLLEQVYLLGSGIYLI